MWQKCGRQLSKDDWKHFHEKEVKIQYSGATHERQILSSTQVKMPVILLNKAKL